jgi:hypothetical protein
MSTDSITVLTSRGPLLTKRWTSDGIQQYDRAKNFTAEHHAVSCIGDLSARLLQLEREPRQCVVRGQHIDHPQQDVDTTRDLEHFEEVPRRWVCLDVDSFEPVLYDPVTEPAGAVWEFIARHLGDEWQGVSHHWQLSASAGAPGKQHLLKAHVWFWLDRPHSGSELEAWARARSVPVDVTVFRTVQVHYTAAPVLDAGVACPVLARSGLVEGLLSDEVTLDMTGVDVTQRAERVARTEMVDPTAKPGLIGAFCRAYPPARVVRELLPDVFSFDDDTDEGAGARLTWQQGGGAAGGACITDDGWHVYNSHATDPFAGRAVNAWDLVRQFKFGDLDRDLTDFERDDPALWPSQRAMREWARGLDDVSDEEQAALVDVAAEREAELQRSLDEIVASTSAVELETVLSPRLRERDWSDVERERLVKALQHQVRSLTGASLPVATVRGWLRAPRGGSGGGAGPEWLDDWCYVTDGDKYFHLKSKTSVTPRGFDAINSGLMPMSQDGIRRESASDWAIRVWNIRTVGNVTYAPGLGETFTMLGSEWANTYRDDSVPDEAEGGEEAIAVVQAHLELLFPDDRERALLLSWMSHNVRHPGKKIRWAPYVYGPQGAGKTYVLELMAMVMGAENVRVLSGSTLKSDFNGWATGSALVGIEEVYQSGHMYDTEEKLKGPIANNTVDVHRKGKDAFCVPNFTNFLLLSNHPDGLPIGEGDRRLFFLRCAVTTEQASSLAGAGYYDRLFDMTRAHVGALRRWLVREVEWHSDFDSEGRAPVTRAREMVIQMSRSDTDVAADDVLRGRDIVCTDWVSAELKKRGVEELRTRSLAKVLERRGYEFIKHIWFDGKTRRVWGRADCRNLDDKTIKNVLHITHVPEFDGLAD